MRNKYKILVGKHVMKPPLERCACKWKNDIEVDLK
jgi:hypothetical protein